MSGSYSQLNAKYNTLYALYLELLNNPSVTPDLQTVLDEGNSANNIGIQLTSDGGLESNYSSTSINFVDNPNSAITTLNNNSLNSFNSTTGKSYNINADGLAMSGSSGTNYTTMGDGILSMTGLDSKYVGLSPSVLDFNGSQGTNGQVLTKGLTNNPEWGDLPVSQIPDLGEVLTAGALASTTIDMGEFDLTNVANIITNTQTNLQGQFVFDTPPHVPDPILGNDATPKGYVDSLVGQYAGGFNLFFNYSQTDVTYPTFKALSQLISSSAGVIVPTTINTGNNFIARFITEPLGIDTIPVGLWDAFIYGAINNTGGDAHYYFELWKKTALNVDSLLGTSGISPDINASPNNNPTSYSMVLTISTAIPLALTDRLYILIYVNYSGVISRSLSTYFEGNYYSFIQTSLNAGTTLLSSNNTWTGTNAFSLPPTTPNQVGTPANTDIVNYGTITDLIDPTVTIINYYITQTNPIFQYPPQPPSSTIINTYGYYGWQFINAVALRKIDWFFAPDYDMEVQDVLGLYMNYFNVASTSNDDLPFITIYTKPLGSGDIIPGFAHSSLTFIPNFTPVVNSPYCSFMNISGVQPTPFAYGHQIEPMIVSPVAPNPRGTYTPTMKVLAIAVGTNSTSPVNSVNFVMSKVGVCVASGNNESVLNPFDATQVGSWVSTATSNLNMATFSIDASANILSLGTSTSTALTLGKSGNTTNIQGNLQIAGQPGTSGQFLTSAGAGGVPTWTTTTTPNLLAVLTAGNSALNKSVVVTDTNGYSGTLSPTTITSTLGTNSAFLTPNTEDSSINATSRLSPYTLQFSKLAGISTRYSVKGIQTFNAQVFDITTIGALTLQGTTPSIGQVVTSDALGKPTWATPTSGWVGTATSQLNMGIYDISGAVMDNSGNTLTLGANTTTTTVGNASTGTTNLQGVVKINNSAGSSGQVLTSTGASTTPTWQTPTSGWSGTALSQLNMGIYDISGAVMDNSGNTLTLGANTTTTTVGNASTGTTNLQGVVKINNSAGSIGEVLTSTGTSTAPTWQTPTGGNITYFQSLSTAGVGLSVSINQIFLPITITVPSITATYLFTSSTSVTGSTLGDVYASIAQQAGATITPATATNIINGVVATTALANGTSFIKTTITNINETSALSFSYIFTPAIVGQRTFGVLMYAISGGTRRTQTFQIIQLTN